MLGVDTNVLLRLSDEKSPEQRDRVRTLIVSQGARGCFVNFIVLTEYAWTLARIYKQSRGQVADRVEAILEGREFVIAHAEEAKRALVRYSAGPADFADYLLAEINRSQGCTATATFDAAALKSGEPFIPVPSHA